MTFAVGDHTRLLEVTRPAIMDYADGHGYDYLEPAGLQCDRPPSWWKVPLLLKALESYDEVLWIDCDVAIVDGGADIASAVSADAVQAMVIHRTPEGDVPNLGVWLVRRGMRDWLRVMWEMTGYVGHPWWEQAAMLDLLGYLHDPRPSVHVRDTELFGDTCFLPLEWNSHEQNDRHPHPRFAHVTPNSVDWRIPILERYLA